MRPDPRILGLLKSLLNGKLNHSSLAEWLALNSLEFYESPNEVDRMIVADLDAALGEIQAGRANDELLVKTAKKLIEGLRITPLRR